MLRSGTSLTQTVLSGHPEMWVAYQPFHQLYVDVKQAFLHRHQPDLWPPLDDGGPGHPALRAAFESWMPTYRFDAAEARMLARRAVTGKGGSLADADPGFVADAGTFLDIWRSLHEQLADRHGQMDRKLLGSKEILCEEYVPTLSRAGVPCVLVTRDPRAVIASANHGRYHESVGDRYPLLMLVRLWRKSAAYATRLQADPLVHVLRYEDLVTAPDRSMLALTDWLGMTPFSSGLGERLLLDPLGMPWTGNSSFGDKTRIDGSSTEGWRDLLTTAEVRFIEACTLGERAILGYADTFDTTVDDIAGFEEDPSGIRPGYLARHALTAANRTAECERHAGIRGDGEAVP